MEATGTNVFLMTVYILRNESHSVDGFIRKFKFHAFCSKKGLVLLYEGILWFRKYSLEIFLLEGLKFYTERETTLKFRNKVTWGRHAESTCTDEKNMGCIYYTPLCIDIAAFYNRKNVALNAFTADFCPSSVSTASCNLVYFINEDDSALFNTILCFISNLVVVCLTVKGLCHKYIAGFPNCYSLLLASSAVKHVLQSAEAVLNVFGISTHHSNAEIRLLVYSNFNFTLFKFSFAKHLPELFAG